MLQRSTLDGLAPDTISGLNTILSFTNENGELTTVPRDAEGALVRTVESPSNRINLSSKVRVLLYLVPLVNAAVEAIQTNYGLKEKPQAMQYLVTSTAFTTSMALGVKFTVKGMSDTYQLIKSRKIPDDWRPLSRGREYLAAGLAIGITGFVAFSDAAQCYYFIKQTPTEYGFDRDVSPGVWEIPSLVVVGTTAVGCVFSEGMETYKAVREMLSDSSYEYTNELSRYLSQIAMVELGYLGAVNDVVIGYMGIKEVLDINTTPGLYVIGLLSLFNGITDYSMNARYIRDSLDSLIEYLANEKVTKKDVVTMLATMLPSGLLSYAGKEFIEAFWKMALEEFGIDASDALASGLISVMAWGGSTYYFSVYTPSLYPLTYYLVDKLDQGLSYIYNQMPACKSEQVVEIANHHDALASGSTLPVLTGYESESMSISISASEQGFFRSKEKLLKLDDEQKEEKKEEKKEEEKPAKRCQLGCTIL